MTGRLRLLLLLLILMVLALAPFASARVLSYAPYTDRTAHSSYHHRGGRWFTLTETAPGQPWQGSQVVLYDARGVEEPRVIYPKETGDTRFIYFTAVYEPKNAPPHILIATYSYSPSYRPLFFLSLDGGNTFKEVEGLHSTVALNITEPDFGGPYSHGLTTNVLVGGVYSFVIGATDGNFAIDHAGNATMLATSAYSLLGRDREGGRFLLRSALGLSIFDAGGGMRTIGPLPFGDPLNGWITADGSAYAQTSWGNTRFLWLYRNGEKTLVASTPGAEPGPVILPPSPFEPTFFAVPTTDYNGAWMIQRQTGKPTTLLRHTIAAGKEMMWTDVSGPQVEALHTGLTKADTLLIQVHRPRAVEERLFLDPALAVWRIGEPAPRGYDELFLNETTAKGFTHLDVDTIADGSPFVFDSGAPQGAILTSPPAGGVGGGGADVMQEWGVVRASLKQRLVLPGVARQGGAFGSFWLTDLVIHNPLAESQDVGVRFSPIGGEVQAAVIHQKTLTLAAHEIRVVKDVMKSLFELEQGGGVLYIEPTSSVTATARTYTRSGEGSFGFGMQAIDAMNAAGPRFPLTFAGAFPGSAFRTNMLLTDTSGRGTEGRLQAHGLSGIIGADNIALSAPANSAQQLNGLAGSLGLVASDAGGLEIHPLRGSLIATVVAMDNRTNDPTFFPPDLSAPVVRTIPAIGHLDGANGSKFRSDLYLLNPSSQTRTVTLQARKWDSTESANRSFTLLPGEARVIPDALFTLFGYTGVARLRYSSMDGFGADGVRVTSRTYNVDENGGTYGCLVPPLNSFQSAGPGEKLEILGIVGGSGFRTNVGFVDLSQNPGAQAAEARVHIVDDTGKELDQFALTFPLAGGTQINDIFNARGIAQPAAAIVYVEVTRGLVAAYATLTDNVTNDSTYLGASLSAQPD